MKKSLVLYIAFFGWLNFALAYSMLDLNTPSVVQFVASNSYYNSEIKASADINDDGFKDILIAN